MIVGGGSGMGDITAKLFAEEGVAVVVADLDEQAAQAVAQTIQDTRPDTVVLAKCVNVTVEASVEDSARFVSNEPGPTDVLVNTFGLAVFVPLVEHKL